MEVYRDFKELLELFNAHRVEYLIVGAYALAVHGSPRTTGDLDLWVNATPENAGRILRALEEFGVGGLDLSTADFVKPEHVVQLGVQPVRVDLVTAIDGVQWAEAWQGKLAGEYGSVPTHYLGRREFVANKRASGRQKDLADLEALDEK
jgi:hypothetical protein